MLYAVLKRFFLLALLACDWAGDPYFGRSPLSRPMASQEAYCHSTFHRAQLVLTITLSNDLNFSCHPVAIALSPPINEAVAWRSGHQSSFLFPDRSLSILMSLQC